MHNYNRQRGGTILGLIIGLIIGLGIALGVAVVINKTPIPFTNKVARHDKAGAGNQMSDPNKALYGNKTAAKEAAKTFVKETEPVDGLPAESKPVPKAEVINLSNVDKPKKAEVKATDIKTDSAAAKPENAEDKWNYYLQAGAFRESTDAENTRAKLALLGVEARVTERQSENGMLYRVRVGPFAQLDTMNRVRGKLSDNGVDAAVVRVAK